MRMRILAHLALREAGESVRARWFPVLALSFFVLSLGLAYLGLSGAERAGLAGYDRTTASLLNLALLFVPLVGLALGALGLAGELEDGSLGMVLAQPVTRAEVFLGKYLGQLASLVTSIVAGFGATGMVIGQTAAGGRVGSFLGLLGTCVLLAAATLAMGTLLSVAAGGRTRSMGAAFGLWIGLVYLSDLGTIGLVLVRHLEPGQVFLLAALNPVHQARILGVLSLTDQLDLLGPAAAFGLEHLGPAGLIGGLVAGLGAATLLAMVLGLLIFRRVVVP